MIKITFKSAALMEGFIASLETSKDKNCFGKVDGNPLTLQYVKQLLTSNASSLVSRFLRNGDLVIEYPNNKTNYTCMVIFDDNDMLLSFVDGLDAGEKDKFGIGLGYDTLRSLLYNVIDLNDNTCDLIRKFIDNGVAQFQQLPTPEGTVLYNFSHVHTMGVMNNIRDGKIADKYSPANSTYSIVIKVFGGLQNMLLQRRNMECINIFLVNDCGDFTFQTFFNQGSPYGKELVEKYNIDYANL